MRRTIRLLDLGHVSSLRSQTVYHAAAQAMDERTPDTVILVSPADPYVCIGFHQDLEKEVDVETCRAHGWPVYRRDVGGGAVFLDANQLFVQWVFHPRSLPSGVDERYRLFIRPIVQTYCGLGIKAYHRPVNDIHVNHKKIGGTGAAQIGKAEVVVGSFLFDFDKASMAKVLKASSEKMRDKIFQGLEDYMTTIREQAGSLPDRQEVKGLYMKRCAEILEADIVPGSWSESEEARARDLDRLFQSQEWLYQKGVPRGSGIKIHEGVRIQESCLKAPGGLIRVTARLRDSRIDDISISGDFTVIPGTAVREIEKALQGAFLSGLDARGIIEKQYRTMRIQSPGIEPSHWAEAVFLAVS